MKLFEQLNVKEAYEAASVAHQEYVSNRSVAIFIRPSEGQLLIGSGTCVRLGERFFIATAAHNIPPAGTSGLDVVPMGLGNQPALPIVAVGSVLKRGTVNVDVAYLEIEPSAARFSILSWVTGDQLAVRPDNSHPSPHLIQGYPADQVKNSDSPRPQVESDGLTTLSIPATRAAAGFQQGVDLALEWPPHDGSLDHLVLPEPPGVSGGGAWIVPKFSENAVWSAEKSQLASINRSWSRSAKELRGTLIGEWLSLVESAYSDLKV